MSSESPAKTKRVPAKVVVAVSSNGGGRKAVAVAAAAAVEPVDVAGRKRKGEVQLSRAERALQEAAIKKKRLELNRLAAIKSRKKKKTYIQSLTGRVTALQAENKALFSDNQTILTTYVSLFWSVATIMSVGPPLCHIS